MMDLYEQIDRKQICLHLVAVPVLLAAIGAVVAPWLCRAGVIWAGLGSAAVLCALYVYGQRVALPLLLTRRLYARLLTEPSETIEGVVLGWKEEKNTLRGVMTRILVLDTGETVRGEPAPREVNVPAVLLPEIPMGETVRIMAREGVALSLYPCSCCRVQPQGGRYAVSPLVLGGLILLCAVGWGGGYALYERAHRTPTVAVAVCTPAYRQESERNIIAWFEENELPRPAFSYTNTLDNETVYQYFATYGALDAECLLLPEGVFSTVFDGDVPALPTETMPDSAALRFVFNADGKPVAVVLYDPQDEEYSARFHALIDWVAVPREERYLLALAPQGREKAEKVLSGLTSRLLSSFSEG